ncbi:hypothetical protein N2152v2_002721 [Parachlorella kessleri]
MANGSEARPARTVLLPVDSTGVNEKLVNWAVENCKGDVVHVLHVLPIELASVGDKMPGIAFPMIDVPEAEINPALMALLKDNVLRHLEAAGIEYKVHVVKYLTDNSSIGEVVCNFAAELKANIVAMCQHQRGAIASLFLGSATK